MRRFYCPPDRIGGEYIALDAGEGHHARNVLRIDAGETVQVLDGVGTLYQGAWVSESCCVRVKEVTRVPPFHCNVTMAVALLKRDHWDWFVQKAVEIGVSRIVPLLARHSIARPAGHEFETKRERWGQIAISALKQSGQAFLPAIELPVSVEQFCKAETPRRGVSTTSFPGSHWILNERGGTPLKTALTPDLKRVTLLVGPEGGWSDEELELSQQHMFRLVTLGQQILRAETVPLYLLSVIRFVTE